MEEGATKEKNEDEQNPSTLFLDFDLTVANTSIAATKNGEDNHLTVDECRDVYAKAATAQDGISFEDYCSTAIQFFARMQSSNVPVVILTNNNKNNVQHGMEAMGLTNYLPMDMISIHELRESNADATKAEELHKYCLQHDVRTSVFVDDSSDECQLMRATFPIATFPIVNNDDDDVEEDAVAAALIVLTVKVPRPEMNTREKGGLFNYPDVMMEVEAALL